MNKEKIQKDIDELISQWAKMGSSSDLISLKIEENIFKKIDRLREYLHYSN